MDSKIDSLIKSLKGADFDTEIVSPKGDTFHHVQSVDVLQGNDDYETTGVLHVEGDKISLEKTKIKTPNRGRTMGGIVITFWSEEYYTWSRQLFLIKGQIYTSDTLLQEDVDMYYEEAKKKKTKR